MFGLLTGADFPEKLMRRKGMLRGGNITDEGQSISGPPHFKNMSKLKILFCCLVVREVGL